jgi:predicted small integral membrane protein
MEEAVSAMSERESRWDVVMVARWVKIVLLAGVQFYFLLVVLNNVADFNTNYDFVQHVLTMDTTIVGNHLMGRAIHAPAVWMAFYVGIILWEAMCAVLCAWGVVDLFAMRRGTAVEFAEAKRVGMVALTVGMLLWLVAFMSVGGEFFLMWQSRVWNGEETAFRMFVVEAVVLGMLMMGEKQGVGSRE